MKISSTVALLLFLASIIAIFQLVQNRPAFPLRAAATPSVTVTSFLAGAGTPIPVFTPILIESPTLSPTLSGEIPTFTATPTSPYTPTLSPTPSLKIGISYCPQIRAISEFALVPSSDTWSWTDEPALDFDNKFNGVAPQLLAYLNTGGDPDALVYQHHQVREVRRADFNSDGVNELLLNISDPAKYNLGGIGLFYCTVEGSYQFGGWLAREGQNEILVIDDFNHDGYKEALITSVPYTSSCILERNIIGWDGTTLRRLFIDRGGNECDVTTTFRDIDGDGYNEMVLYGTNDGLWWEWHRYATWVYKLEPTETGLIYLLDSKVLDPPLDRVHVLEDAATALKNQDFQQAIALYERAVNDPSISFQSWIDELQTELETTDITDTAIRDGTQRAYDEALEGEPYTLAFAYLRLVILHTANHNTAQANEWFTQMMQRFPDGERGSELRILAQTFVAEWQLHQDLPLACSAVNTQYEAEYEELGWHTGIISRSFFGWTPMCPFTE